MTKKRKRYPDLQQKLERPWCFYCERDFDDLKILISHQKAKHFKCDRCGRRLNTAGGLSVHMNQVHKENPTHVENALPGRQSIDVEIFGMEGVPTDVLDAHNEEVTQKHFAEEAERARKTGNPIRGLFSNGTNASNKKVRVKENLDEVETRAAQYRIDRQNGVLPAPPVQEAATNVTPPVAQPFTAPPAAQNFPPPGAPAFPPGQAFPPNAPPSGFPPAFAGPPGMNGGVPGGLPQRPGFGAPPGAFPQNGNVPPEFAPGPPGVNDAGAISASLDELISDVKNAADSKPADAPAEKKSKKDKNVKLVFNDDSVSPEEKMAALPRYAGYAPAH